MQTAIHLQLTRQVLGEEGGDIIEQMKPHSPFLQPYIYQQNSLARKNLSYDQAIILKNQTLNIKPVVDAHSGFLDFLDQSQLSQSSYQQEQPYLQQQDKMKNMLMANDILEHCCMNPPLINLQTVQQQYNITDIQAITIINENRPDQWQSMAMNQNGNYSFQKIYGSATKEQKIQILNNLDLYELSENQHGTRSVQKIIQQSTEVEQKQIIKQQLQGKTVDLILNQHGNHCIQKILDIFKPEEFDFIIQECQDQILKVSCHQLGCCVLQRQMERCNTKQFYELFEIIKNNSQQLVVDQFGNYVFQYLLDNKKLSEDKIDELIATLYKREIELTKMKSSSHVLEKCLTKGSQQAKRQLISNLIADTQVFIQLCNDRYANYVIQKVVSVSAEDQQQKIIQLITNNMQQLQQGNYCKHILSIVQQLSQK